MGSKAPAPKRLGIGKVLSTCLSILRKNAGQIAILTLITQVPFHVGIVLSTLSSFSDIATALTTGDGSEIISNIVGSKYAAGAYAFTFTIGPLLSFYTAASVTRIASNHLVTGRTSSIVEALLPGLAFTVRTALVIVGTEVLCVLAATMLVLISVLLIQAAPIPFFVILMIAGIPVALYLTITWVIGMFIPAISVVLQERAGAVAAMPASKRLTAGNRWRIFLTTTVVFATVLTLVVLSILIGNALLALPVAAEWLVWIKWLWPLISCFLLNGLFAAMTTVLFVVIYEELRYLRDGPRPDAVADVFA